MNNIPEFLQQEPSSKSKEAETKKKSSLRESILMCLGALGLTGFVLGSGWIYGKYLEIDNKNLEKELHLNLENIPKTIQQHIENTALEISRWTMLYGNKYIQNQQLHAIVDEQEEAKLWKEYFALQQNFTAFCELKNNLDPYKNKFFLNEQTPENSQKLIQDLSNTYQYKREYVESYLKKRRINDAKIGIDTKLDLYNSSQIALLRNKTLNELKEEGFAVGKGHWICSRTRGVNTEFTLDASASNKASAKTYKAWARVYLDNYKINECFSVTDPILARLPNPKEKVLELMNNLVPDAKFSLSCEDGLKRSD